MPGFAGVRKLLAVGSALALAAFFVAFRSGAFEELLADETNAASSSKGTTLFSSSKRMALVDGPVFGVGLGESAASWNSTPGAATRRFALSEPTPPTIMAGSKSLTLLGVGRAKDPPTEITPVLPQPLLHRYEEQARPRLLTQSGLASFFIPTVALPRPLEVSGSWSGTPLLPSDPLFSSSTAVTPEFARGVTVVLPPTIMMSSKSGSIITTLPPIPPPPEKK